MARLEGVFPALREGKFVRSSTLNKEIRLGPDRLLDRDGHEVAMNRRWLFWEDWEIVPEPVRVADYFCPLPEKITAPDGQIIKLDKVYGLATLPIGQQPEGSVMVPGSEREQE